MVNGKISAKLLSKKKKTLVQETNQKPLQTKNS
jgi:hypothetical protein